jgi:hypothetical protein
LCVLAFGAKNAIGILLPLLCSGDAFPSISTGENCAWRIGDFCCPSQAARRLVELLLSRAHPVKEFEFLDTASSTANLRQNFGVSSLYHAAFPVQITLSNYRIRYAATN